MDGRGIVQRQQLQLVACEQAMGVLQEGPKPLLNGEQVEAGPVEPVGWQFVDIQPW